MKPVNLIGSGCASNYVAVLDYQARARARQALFTLGCVLVLCIILFGFKEKIGADGRASGESIFAGACIVAVYFLCRGWEKAQNALAEMVWLAQFKRRNKGFDYWAIKKVAVQLRSEQWADITPAFVARTLLEYYDSRATGKPADAGAIIDAVVTWYEHFSRGKQESVQGAATR